jgi:hypothetical protein
MIKWQIRNPIRCILRLHGKLIKGQDKHNTRNISPRVEAPYDMVSRAWILNLGTRWTGLISFTLLSHYPRSGKSHSRGGRDAKATSLTAHRCSPYSLSYHSLQITATAQITTNKALKIHVEYLHRHWNENQACPSLRFTSGTDHSSMITFHIRIHQRLSGEFHLYRYS